ncbi:tautomerase family protein (plasmid) [Agrobacterium vitis]|uniref:tautomerase family protein n=1 Tax=Agrobacterium vitis TaxID=373 RepID=UPI0012E9528A|nr:tautomerase family protein [Agrobacterium vitis]MVA27283.1 tautomerase PptA [Agrobacterium vitis]
MPHIDLPYFDRPLSDAQRARLDAALTQALCDSLDVPISAVSIALEPVAPDDWNAKVALPRIVASAERLLRRPCYTLPEV